MPFGGPSWVPLTTVRAEATTAPTFFEDEATLQIKQIRTRVISSHRMIYSRCFRENEAHATGWSRSTYMINRRTRFLGLDLHYTDPAQRPQKRQVRI